MVEAGAAPGLWNRTRGLWVVARARQHGSGRASGDEAQLNRTRDDGRSRGGARFTVQDRDAGTWAGVRSAPSRCTARSVSLAAPSFQVVSPGTRTDHAHQPRSLPRFSAPHAEHKHRKARALQISAPHTDHWSSFYHTSPGSSVARR